MAHWLMKSEPSTWSWDQQVAKGAKGEAWTGVRNHSAKLFMMQMKKGDRAFFYHSNEGKEIVGIVEIIREHYPDPTDATGKFVCVDIKADKPLKTFVTLNDVKAEKKVAEHIMRSTIGFRGVGIDTDTPVSRLSGGERQGVAIGRAMHFDSDLIVLDEPTVALALREVQKVLDFIRSIKAGGRSCIYIEHNIHHVHEVCDRLVVLERGEIALDTPASALSYNELADFLMSLHTRRAATH